MTQGTITTYNPTAKTVHWLTAFAILGMLITGSVMGSDTWSPEVRSALYTSHKTTGILILLLTLFRLYWRYHTPSPPLPIDRMPVWQVWAARLVHAALYGLLIAIPLSGWALVSTGSHGIQLFGVIPFPSLPFLSGVENVEGLHHALEESHEIMAGVIAALTAIHIGAALKHHFIDRDDILTRISPVSLNRWLDRLRGM
ncbi:MAG TPA: cytochrome B [Rhodospirillaceae bacterium]|nr:cytochrome B [Rhodospirillaceae bacterium]